MVGVKASAGQKYPVRTTGRPCGIVAGGLAQAPRLATLDRPQPQRHLIVMPGKLANQELRVIRRNRKEARVFKGRGDLLRIAPFNGSLHEIPVATVALQKENPSAIGHDAAPRVNTPTICDSRHALHAGPRDGIDDEKEKP